MNSAPHGPTWLSGGSVGPEGSWLVLGVLIIWAIAIHFLFPAKAKSAASACNLERRSNAIRPSGALTFSLSQRRHLPRRCIFHTAYSIKPLRSQVVA